MRSRHVPRFSSQLFYGWLILAAPEPTFSAPNNAVAGGSSYGVSFDWNRADTISLNGASLPKAALTVEFWYKNTNLQSDYTALHCYSAYNARGFQGMGGDAYEAANEVQFGIGPEYLRLWRGTDITDLRAEVNPRAASLTTEWRHYASTVDSDTAEVAFYIDGEQLDFGHAALTLPPLTDQDDGDEKKSATKIEHETLEFSARWDTAEHVDATDYYGTHVAAVMLIDEEDACAVGTEGTLGELVSATSLVNSNKKVVALILRSDERSCSDFDQGRNLAEAGAWMVIFKKVGEPERQVEEADNEEAGGEDTDPSDFSLAEQMANDAANVDDATGSRERLPIAVVSVASESFALLEDASTIAITRTRSIHKPGTSVSQPIERTGILHLGQEADLPWGDFDERQAMNGVLDEYRVWGIARTPEQIRANYRLSIDVQTDEDAAKDLAIYWTFDDEPEARVGNTAAAAAPQVRLTADSSPSGSNTGLLGGLPTIENQLQYVTDRGVVTPTEPMRILTTSSPLVGRGEVVVPVVPGGRAVVVELKSYDPDGDNLTTALTSVPSSGALFAFSNSEQFSAVNKEGPTNTVEAGKALVAGDEVTDRNRTESKRVVYRPSDDFNEDATFTYTVSDGGSPVTATVRLTPHRISQPQSQTVFTTKEDTLAPFSLAMPSQLSQSNMRVEITALPRRGKLYQAQFDPASYSGWAALAKSVDQYGPMKAISDVGEVLDTDRGIVMYQPDADSHSAAPDEPYASFRYRFVDPLADVKSDDATMSIVVEAVNDPPVGIPGDATVAVGGDVTIALGSTDVDADAAESFAERNFARIVAFPRGGRVYQYDAESKGGGDGMGEPLNLSVKEVPQTFAWASRVIRYSSQFSFCPNSCFTWKDPECPMNDVLSGGRDDGSCSETAFHASMILGPPDFYPGSAATRLGWETSSENAGHEFIELGFPYPMYISSFELYETFKPGSLWRVSTTSNYVDDTDRHCSGPAYEGAAPTCSTDTNWLTLWTRPRESVSSAGDNARIHAPPLCPSTVKTDTVRLDFDTSRVPGWNTFDAAKVVGSLEPPPGLLTDAGNRFVYAPLDGVHGADRLAYTMTDCLDEGEKSDIGIAIAEPEEGELSPSVFFTEIVSLDTAAGAIVDYGLDLTHVLQKIKAQIRADPSATGRVWHTTALGTMAGDTYEGISLSNATVRVALGTATKTQASTLELWLEEESGLTFRLHVMVKIRIECENGSVDTSRGICVCTSPRWSGAACSVEVAEDRNEIPPSIKGICYAMFAINVLIVLACLFGVTTNKKKGPVKVAQPFFLYMLLFGCLLCTCTIITLQVEESNIACALRPWLWSIGFSIMFGSLFAQICRVYWVFTHGRAMRRRTVTVTETLRPVLAILAVNTIVLISWTVLDPLHWVRIVKAEDGYGKVLNSHGLCASKNDTPYLASIAAINGGLMVIACYFSYKARHIPSNFHQGKHISLAVFVTIQVYLIGVPVIVIVGTNPSIGTFVESAIIFLTTFAVLLLIFGPLLWDVYRGESEEQLRSVYVGVSNTSAASHASGGAPRPRRVPGTNTDSGGTSDTGNGSLRPLQVQAHPSQHSVHSDAPSRKLSTGSGDVEVGSHSCSGKNGTRRVSFSDEYD